MATTTGTSATVRTTTGHEYGSKGHMRTIHLDNDSIQPIENQVGGHKGKAGPAYILRLGEDRLLKVRYVCVCGCVCMYVCLCVCVCVC